MPTVEESKRAVKWRTCTTGARGRSKKKDGYRRIAYRAGLKPSEYEWMKPKDFVLFIEAYHESEIDKLELFRTLAFFSYAPHVKNMSWQKFTKNVWPSPRDEKERSSKQAELINNAKKLYEQVNGNTRT